MKLGKDFLLGIVNDSTGDFEPLAFAQSCSYDINNTLVKVSSPNTGGVEHYRKKTTGWTMQHEGLIGNPTLRYTFKGQQYDFISLISRVVKSGEPLTCRWHEDDEIKQGQAIVKSYKEVASEKALAKVSVTLQGTGELKDLNPNKLEGAFFFVQHDNGSDHVLTICAETLPIADFDIIATTDYHDGHDVNVGHWSNRNGRTQTFTNSELSYNVLSVRAVRTVEEQTIEQPGVTFTGAGTLHVVLLQTDTRDEQQQLRRTVQALWWGGIAMGDMEVKNTGNVTLFTLSAAGKTGSTDPVEIDPIIDIVDASNISVAITGDSGQTAHCCDCTASLERTVSLWQTSNNIPGGTPYFGVSSIIDGQGEAHKFRCNFRIWANDNAGNEIFSYDQSTLLPFLNMNSLVPAAQNIHWQLEGLGVDDGGPWQMNRTVETMTEHYDVFYAYDATSQKLIVWSPDVPERMIQGLLLDGTASAVDGFYELDEDGNRVPKTFTGIASFTTAAVMLGNGTTHDVSAVSMLKLSDTINIDKMPLYDVILTGEGGVQVGTLPALSSPERTYPTYELVDVPGSIITGAQMPTGAAQTVTYASYFGTVVLKASVTQTGNATWSMTARILGNSDGSGGAAVLPYRLRLRYASNAAIYIEAGQSSVTATGLDYNPAWLTPTATLITENPAEFTILTSPAVDITAAHWTAYKIGLVGGYYCYDIAYLGGTHPELSLTSGNFMFTPTVVKTGEQVADTLYRLTGSSVDSVSVSVKAAGAADWSAATIEHINVNTTDKLHLSYRLRDNSAGITVTDLTNIIYPDVPEAPYSRKSNIADVLPRLSVVYRNQTMIYDAKSLEPLKPGKTEGEEFRVEARSGVYAADEVDTDARFTDSNNNVISVGTGLTGVVVHAVNHGADLPFD